MTTDFTRRMTLALIGAGMGASGAARVAGALTVPTPWLATPEQIAAEQIVLELIGDPDIARIQEEVRAELAAGPRARTIPDAAARLENAIALWTNSLIIVEISNAAIHPAFLWITDDTPRTWNGYALPGVATSGDNPDAIYRHATLVGGGRYEILGRYHPESRPAQVLIEVNPGDIARPATMVPVSAGEHQDLRSASQIDQDQFVVDAEGRFRITVGGVADSPNHIAIPETGVSMLLGRDILSDWRQRPSEMIVRRLDPVPASPVDIEDVRKLVHRDLADYLRFWARFPDIWYGGLKPNTHSPPQGRPGGWGFAIGLNFHLAADEALVIDTWPGGAKYTGSQIIDPWMIGPDARTAQVCLNSAQVTANPDGTVTYVIAQHDPGAANWLDTDGMSDGYALLRWQDLPDDLAGDELIRDFRVVKTSELAALALPRVDSAERKARMALRREHYETRVR